MEPARAPLRLGRTDGSRSSVGMNYSPLVGRAVVLVALVGGTVGFVAVPPLSKIVLRPAQLGTGYRLQMRPDSHCVSTCVTLDMCGFQFRSEGLRTGRLQVNYALSGKVKVSNEVVRYGAGGAKLAIDELNRAVATCPSTPVSSTVQGLGPLTYRVSRLHAAGLLPMSVAMRLHISGTANGKSFSGTDVAVYQADGDYLSGVYGALGPSSTIPDQVRLVLKAARASALNLKHAVG
jgi:hypothetical protein